MAAAEPVIRSEGLAKRYRIRHEAAPRYKALRDVIAQSVRGARGGNGAARPAVEDFWALDDVSFEVARGEVVGIIGRNGAGKSTLLKILSRITEPTRGRVVIEGRVASLLEVGTGFHPELTGRENVFLNGAILGMSRAEIKARFDAIVDFAEVERFLDTPVKRYSSGMYVRLAFAVAAHLEPEILIVDEVLAVGDIAFQKKCLGKMQEVSTGGRTVLFVSHNMAAIQNLCSSALLLSAGRVTARGAVGDVVARYLEESGELADTAIASRKDRRGSGALRLTEISLRGANGEPVHAFASGGTAVFEFTLAIPGDWAGMRDTTYQITVTATSMGDPECAFGSTTCTPANQKATIAHTVIATKQSMTRYVGLELAELAAKITEANNAGVSSGGALPIVTRDVQGAHARAMESILAGDLGKASGTLSTMIKGMEAFQKAMAKMAEPYFSDWMARSNAILADLAAAEASMVTSN